MKKLPRHLRTAEHAPDLVDPQSFVDRVAKANSNSESVRHMGRRIRETEARHTHRLVTKQPKRGETGFVYQPTIHPPHPLGPGALHADFITTEHDGKNPDAQQRKQRLLGRAPWGRPLLAAIAKRERRALRFRGWKQDVAPDLRGAAQAQAALARRSQDHAARMASEEG